MVPQRLAKWRGSCFNGSCPALYTTQDPAMMIAQGKKLTAAKLADLRELGDGETAVEIYTETIFRSMAKYAAEHGDDDLAVRIEEFLIAREL